MDLRADKKSLRKLLGMEDEQFRIPHYQRPYSWTSEQADDLWDDLTENASSGHFLGSIVLAGEDETKPHVIDGQQRLTTLMMILAALRDACAERGMDKDAQRIQTRLTANHFAEGDARYKFKTGAGNWPVFRDFILREPDDPKRQAIESASTLPAHVRERNALLVSNFRRLVSHLNDKLLALDDAGQRAWLARFTNDLMERVELVVIEVKQLADAFLLFETLNDRGLQLSAADLLKSHLLGQFAKVYSSEEDVDEAASQWDGMLEDLGADVDVSRFLRHYLLGYQQAVKKDEVFDHFKDLIRRQDPQWVLDELRTVARIYGEMERPSRVAHTPTRAVLEDLQTLRATTCYIALLPARRYLSESDFISFARLAETLTFRYSTVVGLGTNELERRYRDSAQLLIASEGAELERSRRILIEAMPDSKTFLAAFEKMRMGTQYLLRYTLRRLETRVHVGAEVELKANNLVHIEHILPQTLTDEWRAVLGVEGVERHTEYLNRYGNLALFYYGYNIPASNKSFEQKKEYYTQSDVVLTRELAATDTWDLEAIDSRQHRLAALADAAWGIPGAEPYSPKLDALSEFQRQLGGIWPAVEPYCTEVPPAMVEAWSEELPLHWHGHSHETKATELANRLVGLSSRWETYGARERAVIAGAVGYLLSLEEDIHDQSDNGLEGHEVVVEAAEASLVTIGG